MTKLRARPRGAFPPLQTAWEKAKAADEQYGLVDGTRQSLSSAWQQTKEANQRCGATETSASCVSVRFCVRVRA